MSIKAFNWATAQRLNEKSALVLRTLCWRHNAKFDAAWPSQSRIAFESNGMSISTVKRVLNDLVDLGLVRKTKVRFGGRAHIAYQIDLHQEVRWDRREQPSWPAFVRQKKVERDKPTPPDATSRDEYLRSALAKSVLHVGREIVR